MGLFKKVRKSNDATQNRGANHLKLNDSDLCSPDKHVRMKALSKIEDNDILLDFALNDPHIEVRKMAVELISGEEILMDIAYDNLNSSLRIAALSNPNLKKEKVFLELANDSNKDVRIAAINRINNEDILSDIANNESNREVRKIALNKIQK